MQEILQKESEYRTRAEINQLIEHFKLVPFFKQRKLNSKDMGWICRGLEYQVNLQRSYISKEGDEADKFYIVLKGQVSEWVPVSVEDMVKPVLQFRAAITDCIENEDFDLGDHFFYKFFMDPFSPDDNQQTNFSSFSDFNFLMDPTMKMVHRKYFWRQFQLQRAIDTIQKIYQTYQKEMKTVNSTDGKRMWTDIAMDRVRHNIEQYIKLMDQEVEVTDEETSFIATDSELSGQSAQDLSSQEAEAFVKHKEKRVKRMTHQEPTYFSNIIQMQERQQTKEKLLKQSFSVGNLFQEMVAERVSNFRMGVYRTLSLKRTGGIEVDQEKAQNLERMPPLIQGEFLTQHCFGIGKDRFEYRDGKYYQKAQTVFKEGDYFGEMALLKRGIRDSTFKADYNCELASLHYSKVKKSFQKLQDDLLTPKVHFLQNTVAFNHLSRKKTLQYFKHMEKRKFVRQETVYKAGDLVDAVYIIKKGEFELVKRLNENGKTADEVKCNALGARLQEIEDFPAWHRLNIYEPGSLLGEEDALMRPQYSCTLKCYSAQGQVYRIGKDLFKQLRREEEQWHNTMVKVAYKECRRDGLHIPEPSEEIQLQMKWDKINEQYQGVQTDPLLYGRVGNWIITNGKKKEVPFKLNKNGNPILRYRRKQPQKKLFSVGAQKRPFPCPTRQQVLEAAHKKQLEERSQTEDHQQKLCVQTRKSGAMHQNALKKDIDFAQNFSSKNTLNQYNQSEHKLAKSQTIILGPHDSRNTKQVLLNKTSSPNVEFTTLVSPREADSVDIESPRRPRPTTCRANARFKNCRNNVETRHSNQTTSLAGSRKLISPAIRTQNSPVKMRAFYQSANWAPKTIAKFQPQSKVSLKHSMINIKRDQRQTQGSSLMIHDTYVCQTLSGTTTPQTSQVVSKAKLRGVEAVSPTVSTFASSQNSYPMFNRKFEQAAISNIINSLVGSKGQKSSLIQQQTRNMPIQNLTHSRQSRYGSQKQEIGGRQ